MPRQGDPGADQGKVKRRQDHEMIVGGVLGPIQRPAVLLLGRYRHHQLTMLVRSVRLNDTQAAALASVLSPPGSPHPWPDYVRGGRFGEPGERLPLMTCTDAAPVEFRHE